MGKFGFGGRAQEDPKIYQKQYSTLGIFPKNF